MVRLQQQGGYVSQRFWEIVLARQGSAIPAVLARSVPIFALDIGVALLENYDYLEEGELRIPYPLLTSFALLNGILFSFRMTQAFGKWERGGRAVNQMQAVFVNVTSRLCAMLPHSPEGLKLVRTVRRLLILSCYMVKLELLGMDFDTDEIRQVQLLSSEEEQKLSRSLVAPWGSGPGNRRMSSDVNSSTTDSPRMVLGGSRRVSSEVGPREPPPPRREPSSPLVDAVVPPISEEGKRQRVGAPASAEGQAAAAARAPAPSATPCADNAAPLPLPSSVSSTNSKLTTCRQVEMVVRYWLEDNLWKAFTLAGHVGTPARMRTDMDIDKLVQARDEIELLTTTQLPLEYAQASHHAMCADRAESNRLSHQFDPCPKRLMQSSLPAGLHSFFCCPSALSRRSAGRCFQVSTGRPDVRRLTTTCLPNDAFLACVRSCILHKPHLLVHRRECVRHGGPVRS